MNYRTRSWFFIEELLTFHLWRRYRIPNSRRSHLWHRAKTVKQSKCHTSHNVTYPRRPRSIYSQRHAIRHSENPVKGSQNITHLATSLTNVGRGSTSHEAMQSSIMRTLLKIVKTSHISQRYLLHVSRGSTSHNAMQAGVVKLLLEFLNVHPLLM